MFFPPPESALTPAGGHPGFALSTLVSPRGNAIFPLARNLLPPPAPAAAGAPSDFDAEAADSGLPAEKWTDRVAGLKIKRKPHECNKSWLRTEALRTRTLRRELACRRRKKSVKGLCLRPLASSLFLYNSRHPMKQHSSEVQRTPASREAARPATYRHHLTLNVQVWHFILWRVGPSDCRPLPRYSPTAHE